LGVGDIKRAILNMATLNMGTLNMPELLQLLLLRSRFWSTRRTLHDVALNYYECRPRNEISTDPPTEKGDRRRKQSMT
jgi:hypothetical protein